MKIIVTGGCGYKGHILVPKLISSGYKVKVNDMQISEDFQLVIGHMIMQNLSKMI
jgi:UDP-glucose 4-epimerase